MQTQGKIMDDNLFKEFDAKNSDQWRAKIVADLKGKSYEDQLIWNSIEGFDIHPFYHNDDVLHPTLSNTENISWKIGHYIRFINCEEGNRHAIEGLKCGIEHLILEGPIRSYSDFETLMAGIQLEVIETTIISNTLDLRQWIDQYCGQLNLNERSALNIYHTPLGTAARANEEFEEATNESKRIVADQNGGILIDATVYHEAGATATQEIAYALAEANEYLNICQDQSGYLHELANNIAFKFSVGTSYFLEIAKFRSFKLLWQLILDTYQIRSTKSPLLICGNSHFAHSQLDISNNILRSTTACMSAIIGGANIVSVAPYDQTVTNELNENSLRTGINTLHILREESHFDKVMHSANGSYYIESLTDQLGSKAWDLFKEVENEGGWLKGIQTFFIPKSIKDSFDKRLALFESKKHVRVGVNKYRNEHESNNQSPRMHSNDDGTKLIARTL